MHSEARMNSEPHSIRDTLFFLGAVFSLVWFFFYFTELPDQFKLKIHHRLGMQSIDLESNGESMEEWTGPSLDSMNVATKSPVSDQRDSIGIGLPESLQPPVGSQGGLKANLPKPVPRKEWVVASPYDRTEIGNFLPEPMQLRGRPEAFHSLSRFFALLDNPIRTPAIHVLHFGDSQIEGDRITGPLRNHWQQIWGGYGPGYISPLQPIPSTAMRHSWSDHWERKARYGKRDSTLEHKRFGIMAAFARIKNVSQSDQSDPPAWLAFEPYPRGSDRNNSFSNIQLSMGQSQGPGVINCFWNGHLIERIEIKEERLASFVEFRVNEAGKSGESFNQVRLEFEGHVPEVNGIGFWSDSGIVVHNLAMRGSSGTLFRDLDREQLTRQLQELRTGLIMLQYGGNAVPYLSDSLAAERYGRWFSSQIRLFKSLVPGTPIIVIGPSDMATKDGLHMITYPMLNHVRNALKQAAFEENALYWDVCEVMGGNGSMAEWAKATPPLASADHVHFTNLGAKKIAELFQKTIDAEWGLWQNDQIEKSLSTVP